jgi:hypothetical protein
MNHCHLGYLLQSNRTASILLNSKTLFETATACLRLNEYKEKSLSRFVLVLCKADETTWISSYAQLGGHVRLTKKVLSSSKRHVKTKCTYCAYRHTHRSCCWPWKFLLCYLRAHITPKKVRHCSCRTHGVCHSPPSWTSGWVGKVYTMTAATLHTLACPLIPDYAEGRTCFLCTQPSEHRPQTTIQEESLWADWLAWHCTKYSSSVLRRNETLRQVRNDVHQTKPNSNLQVLQWYEK